jgi:hypothetical protein
VSTCKQEEIDMITSLVFQFPSVTSGLPLNSNSLIQLHKVDVMAMVLMKEIRDKIKALCHSSPLHWYPQRKTALLTGLKPWRPR